MLKTVRVPAALAPAFEIAQAVVRREFATMAHHPEEGTLRIGGERYVLLRADSLYLGWYTALRSTFGDEAAIGFIYSTAREIGRNDGLAFGEKLGLSEGIARLATGPVHFAHSGWAFVDIFPDSAPASDDSYFLHYSHPNTFETEVQRARRTEGAGMTCQFSAGYSAGWCTAAFGVEVHAREIHCLSRGDALCEFIMAPAHRLDEHAARLGHGS